MIGNGLLEEFVESTGCSVSFNFSIPLFSIPFAQPGAQLRQFLWREGLDLFLKSFESWHRRTKRLYRNWKLLPPNACAQPRASSHVGCSAVVGRDFPPQETFMC